MQQLIVTCESSTAPLTLGQLEQTTGPQNILPSFIVLGAPGIPPPIRNWLPNHVFVSVGTTNDDGHHGETC